MKYIKQFGLQRSGTNAIKALIEVNFKNVIVFQDYLGNKHEQTSWKLLEDYAVSQDPEQFGLTGINESQVKCLVKSKDLPVVINIKDPISWVNSYYKYQLKKTLFKNPDAKFNFDVKFAEKVTSVWESNIVSWLNFHEQNNKSVVFLHEEVVSGLDHKLETLRSLFGLEVSENYPVGLLNGYMRRGTDQQHGEELVNQKMEFNRDYHIHGGWRKDVPKEVLSFLLEYTSNFMENNPRYKSYFSHNVFK